MNSFNQFIYFFVIFVIGVLGMAACDANQSALQPGLVAEAAFKDWARSAGEPYRDVQILEQEND